jgi:APA family basic amino acid/polyamine antiporter
MSVRAGVAESVPDAPGLRRGIGLLDATMLVVGSMIGSGIFIVSAESARRLGSPAWLLLVWIIAGLSTMAAAICCAELAAMLPKAGGQYVFFREAYGPLAGFLFGWTMFLVIQTGTIAAVAVAFAKFLGVLVPQISESRVLFSAGPLSVSSSQAVALLVVAILTATNVTGLKAGTRVQNLFTFAKYAALAALTLLGLALGRGGALTEPGFFGPVQYEGIPLAGGALAIAVATAMVGPLFSQSAWNNVTFAGEEIRDPGRTLPRALMVGCLLVTVTYVLANLAYLKTLFLPAIANAPQDRVATAAATALLGNGAAAAMAAAIMVSTFGCVNGLILSGARVSFAMARDGLFFSRLSRVNRANVPGEALWAQAAWTGVLVLSGNYTALLKYVVSIDIAYYVLLVLAVIVLRRRLPDLPRPFRAPWSPALPLLYAVGGVVLIVLLLWGNPKTTWPGYALAAAGIPVYWLWRRRARIS